MIIDIKIINKNIKIIIKWLFRNIGKDIFNMYV